MHIPIKRFVEIAEAFYQGQCSHGNIWPKIVELTAESPVQGIKTTFNSPVARSLIGKEVGEKISLGVNGDREEMKVVRIEKVLC